MSSALTCGRFHFFDGGKIHRKKVNDEALLRVGIQSAVNIINHFIKIVNIKLTIDLSIKKQAVLLV